MHRQLCVYVPPPSPPTGRRSGCVSVCVVYANEKRKGDVREKQGEREGENEEQCASNGRPLFRPSLYKFSSSPCSPCDALHAIVEEKERGLRERRPSTASEGGKRSRKREASSLCVCACARRTELQSAAGFFGPSNPCHFYSSSSSSSSGNLLAKIVNDYICAGLSSFVLVSSASAPKTTAGHTHTHVHRKEKGGNQTKNSLFPYKPKK